MSTPHPGQQPAAPQDLPAPAGTPRIGFVPQTSDGLRVLRLVLAMAVAAAWLHQLLRLPEARSLLDGGLTLGWSWAAVAGLATLVLLIAGPQPRLATKWAWFWLMGIQPLAVAFLLLEPVPAWQPGGTHARAARLTGGWAFLLALGLGLAMSALQATVLAALHGLPDVPWLLGGVLGL
ncbi:MAG TPA: hypothetical protein PKB06_00790 [Actinotalea sp.]|nr:hypothetical protein [Actinotalea sp.]